MGTRVATTRTRALAWAVAGTLSVFLAIGLALLVIDRSAPLPPGSDPRALDVAASLSFFLYGVVGALILHQQPWNRIGWIFVAMGAAISIGLAARQYAIRALIAQPGSLPSGETLAWLQSWILTFALLLSFFLLLLFPDGRFLSRVWKVVGGVVAASGLLLLVGTMLAPGPLEGFSTVQNPFAIAGLKALRSDTNPGWAAFPIGAIGGFVAIVRRYRRAESDDRQRLKLFFLAAGILALALVVLSFFEHPPAWLLAGVLPVAFAGLPVAAALGILRHQLYGIDVVVSRALVYGALAAFITAIYLGIVVGIGALLGSTGNVVLSLLATLVVAAGFQPLRERARRLANRIVFGKRASPYEMLSEFSERVGETYALDDVLPRMARILGEGTGADRAQVWLKTSTGFRRAAGWPEGDALGEVVPAAPSQEWPEFGRASVAPVRHHGELLGVLTLSKPPSDPVTPDDQRLLSDLASQAGLVLNNVRLTEELRARLEELKASRQRIVTAQDHERRRLERNIHDGAQQQLVALAVKARLVEALVGKDQEKERQLLEQIQAELNDALNDLRELARGIYPPLLADRGLVEALRAQARKAAVPVELEADGIGRYPQEIEATVYFCALEAIQNVAKYAHATAVRVRLRGQSGSLVFEVQDDGVGFDPKTVAFGAGLRNMADRIGAVEGTIEVRSQPGAGTTVVGRIPIGDASAPETRELDPPVVQPEPAGR
jgi:signal transduction histidine kinase